MAKIPFANELSTTVQAQSFGTTRNYGTVENLAREESDLAKMAGVAGEAVQKFAIQKQNELDIQKVQGATAAWKEVEFESENLLLQEKLGNAEGSLSRQRKWWDDGGAAADVEDSFSEATEFAEDGSPISTSRTKVPGYKARQSQAYQKYQSQYDSLDDRQRRAVDTMRLNRRADYLHKVMGHETAERKKNAVLTAGAAQEQSLKQAISNYDNPKIVKQELQDMENSVRAISKLEGWDLDQEEAEVLKIVATAHDAVINQFLAEGTPEGVESARVYAKEHTGELTTGGQAAVTKAIRDKFVDVDSDEKTKSISASGKDWVVELGKIKDSDVRKATRTKLYQQERLANHASSEHRRKNESTLYDHVRKNKGKVDFQKLGAELQPLYDSLSAGAKKSLKGIADEEMFGEKKVNPRVDAIVYERLSRLQYLQPDEFKKISFAMKFHGQLSAAHIRHFADVKAKMFEGKMSETKDRLSNVFDSSGWSGEDNAPRRGQVRIDIQDDVDAFKNSHDGRAPDDKEMKGIIQDRVGKWSYINKIEKANPIEATPPKPMAGMSATQRGTFQLGISGITKKDKPQNYYRAMAQIDTDIEAIKARNGGQITEKQELNVARRVANDKVYVDGTKALDSFNIGNDDHVLRTDLPEDTDPNKIYVLVGEDMVFVKDLVKMSAPDRDFVAKELARTGVPDTAQNIAAIWRERNPETKLKTITIQNPSGGKTTTSTALRAAASGLTADEMGQMTKEIGSKYGKLASTQWEMMIEAAATNTKEN